MILMFVVVVMKRLPTIIVPIGYQKQVKLPSLEGLAGISVALSLDNRSQFMIGAVITVFLEAGIDLISTQMQSGTPSRLVRTGHSEYDTLPTLFGPTTSVNHSVLLARVFDVIQMRAYNHG